MKGGWVWPGIAGWAMSENNTLSYCKRGKMKRKHEQDAAEEQVVEPASKATKPNENTMHHLATIPELIAKVVQFSHYTDFAPIRLVNKEWNQHYISLENELLSNNLACILTSKSFFTDLKLPNDFVANLQDKKAFLQDRVIPILKDYSRCKHLFEEVFSQEWTAEMDSCLSIVGSVGSHKKCGDNNLPPDVVDSSSLSCIGGLPFVPPQVDQQLFSGDFPFIAQLFMRDFKHSMVAQSVFPKTGALFFFQNNYNHARVIHVNDEIDESALRDGEIDEENTYRAEYVTCIKDTLFLNEQKIDRFLPKMDWKEMRQLLDKFTAGFAKDRPKYTFRDGYWPTLNIFGGEWSFCSQGNSVLSDGQVLLLQTFHETDMHVGSFIFYWDKDDVGNFDKVQLMMTDDA